MTPPVTAAAPSTEPAAATGPPVLERGVVHEWVVYSQRRLNTLGYGPIDADGRFGPATQAAVVRFEQANTTVVDGRLEADERLLLLSNDALAAEPVPQPVPATTTPTLPAEKLVAPPSDDGLATAETARTNGNCQAIEAEFVRQGAEPDVADQFAYVIAPRESGCVAQHVSTATDLSYSRLGLNFIGVMPRYWGPLCGVTDYRETAELSVDVRCGLAAYRALGWKPWT